MRIERMGLAAAGLLLAAGCSHKPTVVGTWNTTSTTQQGGAIKSTLTLTQDGKETLQAQAASPIGSVTIQASGTYTATDATLTQTFTSVTMNGKPMPMGAGPKSETDQIKLDGDTLTLTPPNGRPAQTLTRAK